MREVQIHDAITDSRNKQAHGGKNRESGNEKDNLTVQDTGIKLEKHGKQFRDIDITFDFSGLQETPGNIGIKFFCIGETCASGCGQRKKKIPAS